MKSLLILISFLTLSSVASATKIVGNGGDVFALEFVAVASDVYDYMVSTEAPAINLPALRQAILDTKIESTEESLSLNGVPKDAINYPSESRIIFNRLRWSEISETQKPAFVLHEYLGILGVDDSSYKYSQPLLDKLAYGKRITEVSGPLTVNFAKKTQYQIQAHITIENYGPESWQYEASEERVRLLVYYKGKRQVYLLPTRGRVISASSTIDGEDDGLYIRIQQPLLDVKGKPKVIREDGNEYIPHVVREYRVEFNSSVQDSVPEDANFSGPISNMAG